MTNITDMTLYEVETSNTRLTGERHTYYILAKDAGDAEKKACREMRRVMGDQRGTNYAQVIRVLGCLVQ